MVSVVENRRRIADIRETININSRADALLDLAEQAEEQGNLTAASLFVLASEVCGVGILLGEIVDVLNRIDFVLKDIRSTLEAIGYIIERIIPR